MSHAPLLILKTGSTHAHIRDRLGDFDDWIAAGLRAGGATVLATHDAQVDGPPKAPQRFSGVVLTGSHHMVSEREPWSSRSARPRPAPLASDRRATRAPTRPEAVNPRPPGRYPATCRP